MTPRERRTLLLAALALAPALLVALLLAGLGALDRGADPEPNGDGAELEASTNVIDLAAGRLLRPGPLVRAHVAIEGATSCQRCHGTGSHVPDARCISCHQEIELRAQREVPYHGTLEGACVDCHVDHRGLDGSLIELDQASFQHAQTRYPLLGAHADLDCESCHEVVEDDEHEASFHYQGLPFASCTGCHADPHGEQRDGSGAVGPIRRISLDAALPQPAGPGGGHPMSGRDCGECHGEASFRAQDLVRGGFDHGRDTHFALRGAHRGVRCEACHVDELREREEGEGMAPGRAAGSTCDSCHDDPHRGELGAGEACARCHTETAWSERFDHAVHTKFALDPLHARLSCDTCHSDQRFSAQGTDCVSCHLDAAELMAGRWGGLAAEPDPHQGHIQCGDCHGDTLDANRGGALAARCADCHSPEYAPLLGTWRARLDDLAAHSPIAPELAERLRRSGVHNFTQASLWLREGMRDAAPEGSKP